MHNFPTSSGPDGNPAPPLRATPAHYASPAYASPTYASSTSSGSSVFADATVTIRRPPGHPLGAAIAASGGRHQLRIVHVSDTHDKAYHLPPGDVLVHSGDMTESATPGEMERFREFLQRQPHRHKVLVCGSHEAGLDRLKPSDVALKLGGGMPNCHVLHDGAVIIEGVKFYGTAWNTSTRAFAMSPEGCEIKFQLIPADTDVLVTHEPPAGCALDVAYPRGQYRPPDEAAPPCRECGHAAHPGGRHWGSVPLRRRVDSLSIPLHLFGRAHHSAGVERVGPTVFSNAAMEVKGRPTIIDVIVEAPPDLAPPPGLLLRPPITGVASPGLSPPVACGGPPVVLFHPSQPHFGPATSVMAAPMPPSFLAPQPHPVLPYHLQPQQHQQPYHPAQTPPWSTGANTMPPAQAWPPHPPLGPPPPQAHTPHTLTPQQLHPPASVPHPAYTPSPHTIGQFATFCPSLAARFGSSPQQGAMFHQPSPILVFPPHGASPQQPGLGAHPAVAPGGNHYSPSGNPGPAYGMAATASFAYAAMAQPPQPVAPHAPWVSPAYVSA